MLGLGLIVAIGAQNAFVLRQGLLRRHVFVAATVCFLCDATLIALGAAGFGTLVANTPSLPSVVAWGGAAFLFGYGIRAFRSALHPGSLDIGDAEGRGGSPGRTAISALALSLLNPHVYLDTVVLLGGVAGQHEPEPRIAFALGAAAGSCLWFYCLGYGAGRLAPLFRRPAAWRILDLCVGAVMWTIAFTLVAAELFRPA